MAGRCNEKVAVDQMVKRRHDHNAEPSKDETLNRLSNRGKYKHCTGIDFTHTTYVTIILLDIYV